MKLKIDKLLKNKLLLYIVFFLSLVTIFGYLIKQNYAAILFFTLVAFLTKYFSTNMIIILGVSILATNLLHLFKIFSKNYLEGMTPKEEPEEPTSKKTEDKTTLPEDKTTLPEDKTTSKKTEDKTTSPEKTLKSGMTNLNPASLGNTKNSGNGNVTNYDDAKLKELAFDNIDKILGSDNNRSFTSDALSLNDKQNKIMAQLKDFGPMLNKAMDLIKNVDLDAMNSISNQMGSMITNLKDMKSNESN